MDGEEDDEIQLKVVGADDVVGKEEEVSGNVGRVAGDAEDRTALETWEN